MILSRIESSLLFHTYPLKYVILGLGAKNREICFLLPMFAHKWIRLLRLETLKTISGEEKLESPLGAIPALSRATGKRI
jgi:hypothetical protein